MAWWEFRYSSTYLDSFFVGNGESLHSWILIWIENSGYSPAPHTCLSLTINGNLKLLPIRLRFSGLHHLIWCNFYESLSWIPSLQTSCCLAYKDINGKLMCLLANKNWHWQAVSWSCCTSVVVNQHGTPALVERIPNACVVQSPSSMSFISPCFLSQCSPLPLSLWPTLKQMVERS